MAADRVAMVQVVPPSVAPGLAPPVAVLGTAGRLTRGQKAAARSVRADSPCTPVLVRAHIVGPARMPRAALDVLAPDGTVLGHLALPNTSAAFDPDQRFWLVGPAEPGAVVALVSEGQRQAILPGGPLRAGPAEPQEWSALACRLLGWHRAAPEADAPPQWEAVFRQQRGSVDSPEFLAAVRRFRIAAVLLPLLFFLVCFPYLFVIPAAVQSGTSTVVLLALPVVGGVLMTLWSTACRRSLVAEAARIEDEAARWGKEVAFTQSYWSGMRKAPVAWRGALPDATRPA